MTLTAKCCFAKNQCDSLMSKVELLEANPHYALIQHLDGRQSNILIRDLASTGGVSNPQEGSTTLEPINFPTDSINYTIPSAVTAVSLAIVIFSAVFHSCFFLGDNCFVPETYCWKEEDTAFIPFLNILLYP